MVTIVETEKNVLLLLKSMFRDVISNGAYEVGHAFVWSNNRSIFWVLPILHNVVSVPARKFDFFGITNEEKEAPKEKIQTDYLVYDILNDWKYFLEGSDDNSYSLELMEELDGKVFENNTFKVTVKRVELASLGKDGKEVPCYQTLKILVNSFCGG